MEICSAAELEIELRAIWKFSSVASDTESVTITISGMCEGDNSIEVWAMALWTPDLKMDNFVEEKRVVFYYEKGFPFHLSQKYKSPRRP